MDGGGSVLMMLGEGGETRLDTNVNFLLEEYGIMVNNGENYPRKQLPDRLNSREQMPLCVPRITNTIIPKKA